MALTLTATINSVSIDCVSVNFSDTTPNYGTGGNPNYSDILSVKWELYDSSFTNLLGTFDTSGWTPYPSNDINLYASEFGVGTTFTNGTYGIKYTITYANGSGGTAELSDNSNTFTVSCGASYCNTTLNHTTLASMGSVTYPTTVNAIKINNVTLTPTSPISVSSLSDMASKINAYIAAQTGLAQSVKFANFVVSGTSLVIENPYYTGLSQNSVTLVSTPYAGSSNSTTTPQVMQLMSMAQNCTTGVVMLYDQSGLWTGSTFPQFADITGNVTLDLYSSTGTLLDTASLDNSEFQAYIESGEAYTDLFTYQLTPCVEYYINPIAELANGDLIDCYEFHFKTSYCEAKRDTPLQVSLEPQVTSNCTQMVLCDNTGLYNATYNPLGYGGANPSYNEVARTSFEFTLPNGDIRLIESTFVPSEYGNNCVAFSIADLFGQNSTYTQIPVGVYPCTYRVYAECDELLSSVTINIFYACGLKACLDNRAVETCGCTNCNNNEVQELLLDYANYMRLSAVAVENPECANNDLQKAYQNCIVKCTTCTN